jgi:hypothetical protein
MKRIRIGFRPALTLLGRPVFPNALVVVARVNDTDARRLVEWVESGKTLIALVGNSDLRAWADKLFIEVSD